MTKAEDLLLTKLQEVTVQDGYDQKLLADTGCSRGCVQTAFVTPVGQYEFLRMPFGIVSSLTTLVRGLKKVLEGLSGVGSYVNDIVIYNDGWEEHLRTLKELFVMLRRARITARPTKCLIGANRMEFLGHQIGGDVITSSQDNLDKVQKTQHLTTKKQVRFFLGLVGYYRDHIPAFAKV